MQWLRSWVVTLSKSLYPNSSSIYLAIKQGPAWLQLHGLSKKIKKKRPIDSAIIWLDFGCQHHTSDSVDEFVRVPSLRLQKKICLKCQLASCVVSRGA